MQLPSGKDVRPAVRLNVGSGGHRCAAAADSEPLALTARPRREQPLAFEPDPCLHERLGERVVMVTRVLTKRVFDADEKIVTIQLALFVQRKRVEMFEQHAGELLWLERERGLGVRNHRPERFHVGYRIPVPCP
jgi:hypothetical protein